MVSVVPGFVRPIASRFAAKEAYVSLITDVITLSVKKDSDDDLGAGSSRMGAGAGTTGTVAMMKDGAEGLEIGERDGHGGDQQRQLLPTRAIMTEMKGWRTKGG
jgi:hypothetical protein